MSQLFTGNLLKWNGDKFTEVDGNHLAGKVVALYFSAHWCPPCKAFTPVLRDFYEELDGEAFEVIFLSLDHSEDDMKHYMKEMHGKWCAVKFGDAQIEELSGKYSVQSIPTLVIIKPDGTAVTTDARNLVQKKDKAPATLLKDWKASSGL